MLQSPLCTYLSLVSQGKSIGQIWNSDVFPTEYEQLHKFSDFFLANNFHKMSFSKAICDGSELESYLCTREYVSKKELNLTKLIMRK
jgi:hypothetical protein